ncbi:MAG: SpoIID/LytB domain-containing protein [Gemmatimonadetes bacterium]|nr:SpoIID/LytB domain-containing protein [Gemmatimonadota bacterium]
MPEPAPRDSISVLVERAAERDRDASVPLDEAPPAASAVRGRPVRVALGVARGETGLSSTGGWRLLEQGGESMLARMAGGDLWRVEQRGDRLRAVQELARAGARESALATAWRGGSLVARPDGDASQLRWGGRRYRGELLLVPTDSGILVVNRVGLEEYLRAVVAGEIGNRTPAEHAAAEAQAVAARSYTWVKLGGGTVRGFDVVATVLDQVYGGVEAETAVADAAVRATTGIVLSYGGRVVNAPYHSACGGSTAEAPEVWRTGGEPYLRRVSDAIPGTTRAWCDIAPRYRWTATFTGDELDRLADRYLAQFGGAPAGGVGGVRGVRLTGTTASGRAAGLSFETGRGRFDVRANDLRFVLRKGGEILNSTWIELEAEPAGGGLRALTIRGRGYGHGVGMCQWGAIGRARAGRDFREILATYYPGTQLRRVE